MGSPFLCSPYALKPARIPCYKYNLAVTLIWVATLAIVGGTK